MPNKACANDKLLRLFFDDTELRDKEDIAYNLGAALTGFLRVDTSELDSMYDVVISKFLHIKNGRLSEEDKRCLTSEFAVINEKSPYLIYYSDILTKALLSVANGKQFDMTNVFECLPKANELYESYRKRFDEDRENTDKTLLSYYPEGYLESRPKQQKTLMLRSVNSILCIKEAILLDIDEKKSALSEELELLYGDEDGGNVDSRKLLLLDMERSRRQGRKPYYINAEFTVIQELLTGAGARINDGAVLTAEYLEQNGAGVYELYDIGWLDDLIKFEFLKTLEKNILIRRCQNCGKLFAPSGRVDTIYCGDIYENTGKTCAEIGAINKYKEKTASNPVHEAFNKAYKRNNSRVRNNKMTKQEFKQWLAHARIKRTSCIEGEIRIEEFKAWLGNK